MICKPFDVIAVPFPFSDSSHVKLRPSIVLSRREFNAFGVTTIVMITSAMHSPWPGDVPLHYEAAGLKTASVARLKLTSIDNRLIRAQVGRLAAEDQVSVVKSLRKFLQLEYA